jgi:hypothetical protein
MTVNERRVNYRPTKEELEEVDKITGGDYAIPRNFVPTGPAANPADDPSTFQPATSMPINPQTVEFCKRFNITDPMAKLSSVLRREANEAEPQPEVEEEEEANPVISEELQAIFDEDDGPLSDSEGPWLDEEANVTLAGASRISIASVNPDEISIDDLGDDDEEDANEEGRTRKSSGRVRISLPAPRVSDVDDFVLDTTGDEVATNAVDLATSSPLPAPKYEVSDSIVESAQGDLVSQCQARQETGSAGPEPKKFKRRNAAMYANDY